MSSSSSTYVAQPSYFVAMIDYGRDGREAVVDPEVTRAGVIDRIRSGEWKNVSFVHFVHDGLCEDVTEEIVTEADVREAA